MIMSLKDSALTADPLAALKQVAAAGGFINVYIGYADKTAIFSNPDAFLPIMTPPDARGIYKP